MEADSGPAWAIRAFAIDLLCLILERNVQSILTIALGSTTMAIVCCTAFLPFGVLEMHATPYHRGYFCNDESIRYPYKGDTVSILTVGVVGILGPIAIIVVCETVQFIRRDKSLPDFPPQRCTSACSVPGLLVALYKIVGIFLFGAAVSQSITDIGKFSIGRLRPHFIDVCRPNLTSVSCTLAGVGGGVAGGMGGDGGGTAGVGSGIYVYVADVECTGTADAHQLKDARMSFPSGHSSLSAYCAIFAVLYIQSRLTWRGSRLARHMLQALCVYAAVYVCLSRISDYKHHWSDVLSGAVIGVFCASLTCLHVSRLFGSRAGRGGHAMDGPADERVGADSNDAPVVLVTNNRHISPM